MISRMRKQRDQIMMFPVKCHKGPKVHLKEGIRVQQEEGLRSKPVPQPEERPGRTQRFLFHHILKVNAQTLSVSEIMHDLVRHMGHRHRQVPQALLPKRTNLPFQDRSAPDWNQRLGNVRKPFPDTHSPAAGHNDCFHFLPL